MADTKQFSRLTKITKGNTPSTDLKMTDIFAMQHIDLPSGANAYKQVSLAQSLCEPIAVTPNSTPSDGAYTATCSNYPDFSLTYTDASGNSHYLIGLKVRVVFTKGITYGSVSGGTYPTLNINGSGAIPLLAQGMTMAKGAAQNGQTIEFTIIPYGNGVAFDADSNVRESTSDYTIYTDGLQRVNAVISGNKNMVTSDAVARNLSPLGKQVLIYNGETYDGTEKSLTQSLKNFRYLYIGLKTNIEYDYMFLPTENIRNGDVFARTMMFSNTLGQTTLPFSYQSSAKITIVSPTSFYVQSVYNNINWILKVYAIWGIN